MRAIKPMHIGFLSRCFEHERRFYMSIATLTGFSFDGSARLMSEMALWTLVAKELGDEGVIDDGLPKSRSEFLVRGKAFCPGGRPQTTCPVKVKVAGVEKTLYVIGDRFWRRGVPTEPVPFTSMDLTWSRAFGGAGFARNPQGRGAAPIEGEDGKPVHPLPNVELPGNMITSEGQRPDAAGFLPYGFDWPQRREKLGTYDAKWFEEDFPGFPRDIDWSAFNVAPPDQHLPNHLVGDEEFVCTNMHPEKAELTGRMPRIRTRAFMTFKGAKDPDALTECTIRPTTLWLFPHLETGIVVSHGALEVGEDDGYDVDDLVLAAENIGEPRPIDHYKRVRAAVKSPEPEALIAIVEGTDLVPEGCEGIGEIAAEVDALSPQLPAVQALSKRAQRDHEAVRAQLEAEGMDPSMIGAPPEPYVAPTLGNVAKMIEDGRKKLDEAKKLAEERRKEAEAEARKHCEEHGQDYDAMMARAAGPPDFDADRFLGQQEAELHNLRLLGQPQPTIEAMLANPEYRAQVYALEKQAHETYLLTAHVEASTAPALSAEDSAARRTALLALVQKGESIRKRNWTAVDVSGEDLSGADLSGGWFEHANFERCNLSGANLESTVLANAKLDGANLSGAKLDKANLGRASLKNVVAERPPLAKETTFDHADLSGAKLSGVMIEDANIEGAKFDGADLGRSVWKHCVLTKCSLRGTDVSHADLKEITMVEVDATGLVATGATLEGATLHKCRAEEAKVDRARATNLRITGGGNLARSDFTESILDQANFRDVDLTDTIFVRARLNRADLSSAKLLRANLEAVVAREALMIRSDFTDAKLMRADLMNAILSKAILTNADLQGASAYGSDLSRVRSNGGTNLSGVNQTRARVRPFHPPKAST